MGTLTEIQQAPPLTLSGRVPGTPLRNPKHEQLCHAIVNGKTCYEAALDAGYKDSKWIRAHISTIRSRPEVVERIEEVARKATELCAIYDAWILADCVMFERASLAHFFRRNEDGGLELTESGEPIIDFRHATEDQLRTLKEFSRGRFGPKITVHDPRDALDKLMRHRGLLKDRESTGPAITAGQVYLIADRPMTEEEWERQRAGAG